MDTVTINILVSTGGAVIVGVFGMFFTANQLGKRIDDTNTRIGELRMDFKELRNDLAFKDVVTASLRRSI